LPIRIYALAKQLKLDSKVLVDICTKAGVTGKGSALASLTDEEMATVTAFIAGGKAARFGAPAAPSGRSETAAPSSPFRREDYIAPAGTTVLSKVPVLPPSKHEKPAALKKKPDEASAAPVAPPVAPQRETEPQSEEEIEKARERSQEKGREMVREN